MWDRSNLTTILPRQSAVYIFKNQNVCSHYGCARLNTHASRDVHTYLKSTHLLVLCIVYKMSAESNLHRNNR